MAAESRSQDLDVRRSFLGSELEQHPGKFDFFQAVRLMERLNPGRVAVGVFGPPEREVMRFTVNNSLAFPPSQIHALEWPENGQPKMTVNFMGLTGPAGVLPYVYTELVRDRTRAKNRALADFFDLFNHRMISLFYQAWEKYRFFVAYERDQQDRFSRYLLSFIGLATAGLQNRQAVRDESLLFYSGLLALQPRSAAALEQIIADYFGVPVEVEQFVGAWYPVSSADQCCFDADNAYSEQLGLGAIAGDAIWDLQSRARLKLGPLKMEKYVDFLPSGKALEPLRSILRLYSGNEVEFEVQLVLERDDVPRCELDGATDPPPLLGWTTWMKSGPSFGRNPADTILLLN